MKNPRGAFRDLKESADTIANIIKPYLQHPCPSHLDILIDMQRPLFDEKLDIKARVEDDADNFLKVESKSLDSSRAHARPEVQKQRSTSRGISG